MNEAQRRVHEGFARLRAALRRCRACGYDRREHRTGRCPECGLEGDLFGERREALAWLAASSRGFAHRPIPRLAARWLGGRRARWLAGGRTTRGALWMLAAAMLTILFSLVRVELGLTLGWGADAARGESLSGEYQRVRVSPASGRVTSDGRLSRRPWSGDVLYERAHVVGVVLDMPDGGRIAGLVIRLVAITAGVAGLVALASLMPLASAALGATTGVLVVGRVVFAPWLTVCALVTMIGDLLHALVVIGLLLLSQSYVDLGPAFFVFVEVMCVAIAGMGGLVAMSVACGSMQREQRPAEAD